MGPTVAGLTIGINGMGAFEGGIVRVLECLVGAAVQLHEVQIVNAPSSAHLHDSASVVTSQGGSRRRALRQSLMPWPRVTTEVRVDVAPGLAAGLRAKRRVLIVNDLAFLRSDAPHVSMSQRIYRQVVTRWSIRKADVIVAISEQTKQELVRFVGGAAGKVSVLLLPVDHVLNKREHLRVQHDRERPVVLAICQTPNKGFEFVIALMRFRPDLNIRVVTNASELDRLDHLLGSLTRQEAERLTLLTKVTDNQLLHEYLDADAFLMASTYEGFGLPVAEALALRTPTVISDLDVLDATARGYAARAQGWTARDFSLALDHALASDLEWWEKAAAAVTSWDWTSWTDEMLRRVEST